MYVQALEILVVDFGVYYECCESGRPYFGVFPRRQNNDSIHAGVCHLRPALIFGSLHGMLPQNE